MSVSLRSVKAGAGTSCGFIGAIFLLFSVSHGFGTLAGNIEFIMLQPANNITQMLKEMIFFSETAYIYS